jgi:hypothetical protein
MSGVFPYESISNNADVLAGRDMVAISPDDAAIAAGVSGEGAGNFFKDPFWLIPDIVECICVIYRGKGRTAFVEMGLK